MPVTREEVAPPPSASTPQAAQRLNVEPPPPTALPPPVRYDFGPHGEQDGNWVKDALKNPPYPGWKPRTCASVPILASPPPCEHGATGYPAAQIEEEGERFLGQRISIYGVLRKSRVKMFPDGRHYLGIGDVTQNTYAKTLLMGPVEGPSDLFSCKGDGWITCCSQGGVGQTVLATGVLTNTQPFPILERVSLCVYQAP